MLFRRRKPAGMRERVRTFVWPRRSIKRSVQYYTKRILRLSATPHAIAVGAAAGVFASFTPFLGFHLLIAIALSWLLSGNIVASTLATFVGNPLTYPFIWAMTLETGRFLLYGSRPSETVELQLGGALTHLEFTELWQPLLKPMTIGCIPLGILFGLVAYALTRRAAIAFRKERRRRLAERARRKASAQTFSAKTVAG
ncbi:DUF2062 domain-containing protein [Mesorhizobium sp. J18]|uniref:DUF2062 domain-containing protein n=1 Tax=Mesorhizobium sp. J18 TaxID=935263 RepID=UPI0011A9FEB0|nr:DUF2062 domain-containing protein [Mesorhizobium sp. J18]